MAKKKKSKTLRNTLIIIGFFVLTIGGFATYMLYTDTMQPNIYTEDGKNHYLYVYPYDNLDSVVIRLEKEGIMKDINSFRTVAEYEKLSEKLIPGRYELTNQMSNVHLVRNIIYGRQTPIRITFNNIRTANQLCEKLSSNLLIDSQSLSEIVCTDKGMEKYGLNRETAVSMFIPNTYEVYWTISAEDLVDKMNKEYSKFWNEARCAKCDSLGLSKTEVSTLASIVEEETKNASEQPRVAGLYINRLKIGMPLQADPTVKFAIGDFGLRRIRKGHIEVDSPYNTYKYQGLPPGPIRIPSISVIDAVLNAENHKYIYMCASEKFDGTHNFATNYNEHQKNAEAYRRALNRKGIK